jgi:hypothetical protein
MIIACVCYLQVAIPLDEDVLAVSLGSGGCLMVSMLTMLVLLRQLCQGGGGKEGKKPSVAVLQGWNWTMLRDVCEQFTFLLIASKRMGAVDLRPAL